MKKVTNFQITFLLLVLCTSFLSAQTTWTGNTSTAWNDPTNWSAGVPDAADDVTIPEVATNDPIISTAAVAHSVSVMADASLEVTATHSLTINGFAIHDFGNTAGLYNEGAVTNNGNITLGSTASVGNYGIWNKATFNNTTGELNIDNTTVRGIWNVFGTFTNAADINIGANSSVGVNGIDNRATFDNLGGEINIDNSTLAGISNNSGGIFTNSAIVNIGANHSVGTSGISNGNLSTFNNNAGELNIDNSTNAGIANSVGSTVIFTNSATINIGANHPVGLYGISNGTLATFNNTTGVLNIDNATQAGINNGTASKFYNLAIINIGAIASVGSNGIENEGNFNNNAGDLNIDNSTQSGIFNDSGTFLNLATINIGANTSVGLNGVENETIFRNNAGVLNIDNATSSGISNKTGGFFNLATINIGTIASVGPTGIENQVAAFNNTGCDALINIVSNSVIIKGSTFNNTGTIIENASGNSEITSNSGTVQNLNGGTFDTGTGPNPAITATGHIWSGCVDTDWDNPSNWHTGTVPTAFDNVTIPDVTNDPVIPNATLALAKSVTLNTGGKLTIETGGILTIEGATGNGILNNGAIENAGEINIDDTASDGIANQLTGTTFTNQGKINIGANQPIGGNGVRNLSAASFTNETGAEINIDDTAFGGIVNANIGTSFTNQGKINIGANKPIGSFGIYNLLAASFTNGTGAEINIDGTASDGIRNQSGTSFTNQGKITIGAIAPIGVYGISNSSIFENLSGQINIDDIGATGILNGGTFTNQAEINIGAIKAIGVYGIYNGSNFTNGMSGEINIDDTGNNGIVNENSNAIFTNQGKINIGAIKAIGTNGVNNSDSANFANEADGEINIDDTGGTGISNSASTFSNEGKINIGVNKAIGGYGVSNTSSSSFTNETDGEINIDRSTSGGIYNNIGSFTNEATITIGAIASVGSNGIENQATFNNQSCAEIYLFEKVDNLGTMTNAGLFSINTANTSVPGTFTNNGVIEDIQGTFPAPGGGFTNNDLIVAPIAGECTIADALQLGGVNDFTADSEWFTDLTLTNKAGDYVPNTFTPTSLNEGTHTLYFTASNGSCTFPLSVQLEYEGCCPAGNILYVDQAATTGANTGLTWTDAFTDLQDALNSTCPGITEIWVAAGTYKPTSTTDRTISFVMKDGVAIYGGFAGGETSLTARDWMANVTTLSGEIGAAGNADNSYHVIYNNNTIDNTAVLDGFTITAGKGGTVNPDFYGGGMLNSGVSPTVTNCRFFGNESGDGKDGGGMANINASSPTVTNCSFSGNLSLRTGGGMYNNNSSPTVTNCSFSGNEAGSYGGGMSNEASSNPKVTNCSFSENAGGGMHNIISSPTVTNCIFWGNGIEIGNNSTSFPSVTYSIVEGGCPANATCTNVLDVDPLFVNAAAGDLSLQQASLAIDAGDDGANSTATDLAGNARKFDAIPGGAEIDMGAFEFQSIACVLNALCASPTVQLDGTGSVSVNAVDLNNGSTGCGTLNFAIGGLSSTILSCADIGANPLTLTVTDDNGSATCTATVTVQDVTPPDALCKDITKNVGSGPGGNVTLLPSEVDNGSSDNCGAFGGFSLVSVSPNSFDCSTSSPQTVTLTVKDAQNLMATCTATVTLFDLTDPVAVCQSATIQLDANGNASLAASAVDNGSSDNCGITMMSVFPSSFTCADVGANSVTLTVEDAFGGNHTCPATVTVQDVTDPTAICQNISVGLDMSGNASITGGQLDGGSTDNCGIASFSASPNTFTTSNIGPNTVTLTVTDDHGRTATCPATVTVTNANPPDAQCKNATVQLDANGNAPVTSMMIDDGSSAIGGIASMSVNPDMLTCADIPQKTVTLTVVGNNGLSASCPATVTVSDVTAPTFTCPANQIISTNNGNCEGTVPDLLNGITDEADNCGTPTLSQSVNANTILGNADGDQTQVTITADDGNGNQNTTPCVVTLTLNDNEAPTFTCPGNQIISTNNGNCEGTVPDLLNGITDEADNCGTPTLSQSVNANTTFGNADGDQTQVTITADDGNGNQNTTPCVVTLTLNDNEAPTFTCPGNQIISTNNGTCEGTVPDLLTGITDEADNCGTPTLSQSVNANTPFIGPIDVTITAADGNGNQNTTPCIISLTLNDDEAPTFTCPGNQIISTNNGTCEGTVPDLLTSISDATDNCGTPTLSQSVNANTTFSGPIDVTITADDGNGNQNTTPCVVTLTLNDDEAPTFTCPGNQIISTNNGTCEGTVPDLLTGITDEADNCGTPTLSQSVNANTTFSGPIDVTITADDGNGNQNTTPCVVTLTLNDNQSPTFTCPGNQIISTNTGNCEGTVPDLLTGITDEADNCGTPTLSQSVNANTTFSGPIDVTITADDGNGNQNTTPCVVTLTLNDEEAPTFTCPGNQVVNTNPGTCLGPVPDLVVLINDEADNCGTPTLSQSVNANTTFSGPIDVTITADDGNGNQNTTPCVVTLTLNDNQAPTFTCPSNQIISTNNGNCEGTVPDLLTGIIDEADNCGTPTLSQSVNANTTFSGPIDVTITADDGNGNQNTTPCIVSLTLNDGEDPVPACLDPTVGLGANGQYTLLETDVLDAANSTDNCGTVNFVSMDITSVDCNDVWSSPVTVTVTVNDGNGNENTCTSLVTVEDNTLPVPTCKTTAVHLDASGNYALTQNDVYGGGTDNCTTVNFWKMTPAAVDCSQAGTTVPVLVEVFDASGNQAACTANVTVEDVEAPVAVCPANIPVVVLDGNGNGSLPPNIGDGSSTDNCSATETSPAMNFNCSAGPQVVTLTVTDGFNTVTANCSFNVVDNQAPVAHCPANIPDVLLDANGNGSLPANIGDGSSTDNCSATETSPALNFTCADVGFQTVLLTASDGTNSSTINCSFNVVDNVLPAANCISQTIQATLDVNAQYTVDPNELNENSTDACGILSLTASPAVLDCQHEGTNTVTLTVTDNNGNTASCTATIEVAEFLTLDPPTATAESCAGAGDGTVSLTATAGGGQVKYSIDGGATFQPSGSFGNLSPGIYTIVVKVFGVPAVCEKTATATVAAGGSPTTWSKDMDGDGYTDGTTVTSCAQPTGYINNPLPGTDCNDNDPLAFPGQTWYEDLDGDGYGSGNTQTSCMRPAGCFTASELIAVDTDCNDLEATVNPAATEICDGLDNNCNGETDEGLSGTYVGNVFFSTQAQLDAWLACYDVIQGSVTIQGGNITDLTPLSNIVEITGNLMILMNPVLTSLDGLENLADVGGAFYLYYNFQLSDCCAIDDLLTAGGVSGPVLIFFNAAGSHCNSAAAIMAACPVAPLVGSGGSNGFDQACSDCIPQGLMTVFPNPTSTTVNVKWSGENPSGTIQLTDLLGRLLMEHKLQSRNEFNVSKLGSGIYLVRVKVDGYKQQVERVVVER